VIPSEGRSLVALWVMVLAAGCGPRAPAGALRETLGRVGGCADSAAAFRRVIDEFQSRQRNPALGVGVAHRGAVVFEEASGLARLDPALPADARMAFSIASVTKAFTGVALLRAVERGTLRLDDEVQVHVPELPRHPSGRPVTLRLLAHHLGAIRHWGTERDEQLYARQFADVREILTLVVPNPWIADSAPGASYSYSSYGYNILAAAIQSAERKSFRDYLDEEVLQPLHLGSVQFDRPGLGGERRPWRYSWYDLTDFRELDTQPQRVPDWNYSHNAAGGGLIASVGDLLRFGDAMRAPGLLSAASLDQLWHRPTVAGVESPMSFGWFVRATPPTRIAISGSNAGVQAGLAVWKDQEIVVAVLANSWGRGSRSGELMNDAADGLLGRLARVCDRSAVIAP